MGENQRGSIRRLSYSDGKVKIQNPIHMSQIQEKMYKAGLIDEYGNSRLSKEDTIFDDFEDEEVMFTADGDIAFDGFGADAQRTIDVKEMVQKQGAEHAVYTLYNAAALRQMAEM